MNKKRFFAFVTAMLTALSFVLGGVGTSAAEELDVTVGEPYRPKVLLDGEVTYNMSLNTYYTWSSTMESYLIENTDGTLTRVEYVDNETGVLLETYGKDGAGICSQKLPAELSVFGGFFAGEECNYFVYGEPNLNQDDNQEVVRVVKYSKEWERLGDCKICGANTYKPFEAGCLRMTETGGKLYVYTCHEMYADDGSDTHHQANMTFVIDESSMEVVQSYYDVANISYGYISHSLNQFIETDGAYIYRVDHGDAAPRAISLTRCAADGSITDVSYSLLFPFMGAAGDNNTGASLGGFALSADGYMFAGNSVDQSDAESYNADANRNIFLTSCDKEVRMGQTVWLTDYAQEDGVYAYTPQLVKVSDNQFLVMWHERNQNDRTECMKLVTTDSSGNLTSDIVATDMQLSDCQPIVTADGFVRWYVTNGSSVVLYTVDPDDLAAANAATYGDLDGDLLTNWNDVYDLLEIVVKDKPATDLQRTAGDVNADGKLSGADALLILQKDAKLISGFPAEGILTNEEYAGVSAAPYMVADGNTLYICSRSSDWNVIDGYSVTWEGDRKIVQEETDTWFQDARVYQGIYQDINGLMLCSSKLQNERVIAAAFTSAENGLFHYAGPLYSIAFAESEPFTVTASDGTSVVINAVEETPQPTEEPVASKDPIVTESPIVSEEPVVSEAPIVSESPIASEDPIASKEPVVSEDPIVSESPIVSEDPIVTESPIASEYPIVTESPIASEDPIVSKEPVVSEDPIVSESPIVSEDPIVSESPIVSEDPIVSERPVVSEDPIVSESPIASKEPVVSEDPVASEEPTPADVIYGDVDNDKHVTASDALAVLQIVVKLKTADAVQTKAADVDGDRNVTAADALQILRKVVKLIDVFPVEKVS